MPFMLKIQWVIKSGSEADFQLNQERLCEVMLDVTAIDDRTRQPFSSMRSSR